MSVSPTTRTWRYILLATFVLVPLVNYLPFALGWFDNRFDDDPVTRVDPAPYAFGFIWAFIFVGMIAFAVCQLRVERETPALRRAYRFLVLAGLASIAFVPISAGGDQRLVFVDLLWHLVALIGAYLALRAHRLEVGQPKYARTYIAVSVYLGWISAAFVIATALLLDAYGIGFDPEVAVYVATGLVAVLTGLGLYFVLRLADPWFAMAVAWALVAVAVEQSDATLLSFAAAAGAVLLALAAVRRLLGGGAMVGR